jgi:hypothetical protein
VNERPGRETWVGAVGLALLVLAAFWPVAAGSRAFFHLDLFYEHMPVWDATQRALAAGDSPFWIDGEYAGHPPLFHQEAPLFYPLTVPLLKTGAAVFRLADLFSLFHYWLAGFAAWLFLRDVTRDPRAAFFGGVAWMLSARLVQSALWPNAVGVSAYLPLLLWGIVRIGRGEERSGVLLAAVSGGLALLLSRPHVLLAAAPVIVAVAVWAVLEAPRRGRVVGLLGLAAVLALMLGAPSLLPSYALYPETSRGTGLTREERDIRPIVPGLDLAPVFLPVDGPPRWPESAAYPGVLAGVLFLAGLGLSLKRRVEFPRGLFLALAAGGFVGLVFAAGERGPYGLVADLPLLRGFRVPARYLTSWSLALAMGSAVALAHFARSRRGRLVSALAIGGLSVDLVVHALRAAPTAPAAVWSVTPDLVGVMRERLAPDSSGFPRRYVSLAETLYPLRFDDRSMPLAIRYYDPLKGASALRFGLETISGGGPTLARTEQVLSSPSARPLELAGVACVVTNAPAPQGSPPPDPPPLEVRPFSGLPRAILVGEAIVVPPENAVGTALSPKLDPRRTAVLEEGDPMPADPAWNESEASVRRLVYRPGRVELEARLPARGVLVVFNAFESGWRADVDGEPAIVERADGAFQAVRLESGTHRVELTYRPPGLSEGLGLGIAGVLGTCLAAIRLRAVV